VDLGDGAMAVSVVIPTLNAAATLAATLAALGEAGRMIREIVVSDGGSTDATRRIAADAGCRVVEGPVGRGAQLARGADESACDWLLFLHADTRLEAGWTAAAQRFFADDEGKAAYFTFALDDPSRTARRLERLVALRVWLFALPYGDQGLLISQRLYREIGGFRPMPLMEDVDIVRRLGRARLAALRPKAVTSAARYRSGYARRVVRNGLCLALYFLGAPPERIARLYG
jgi:rSAM/selenodomain-associated transferase 2